MEKDMIKVQIHEIVDTLSVPFIRSTWKLKRFSIFALQKKSAPVRGFISSLLIFCYLIGSTGYQVNQHFCCGKLVRVEVLHGQKTKDCSGKVPVKKRKCCKDVKLTVKTDDGKKDLSAFQVAPITLVCGMPELFHYQTPLPGFNRVVLLGSHWPKAPPLETAKSPIYLTTRHILV